MSGSQTRLATLQEVQGEGCDYGSRRRKRKKTTTPPSMPRPQNSNTTTEPRFTAAQPPQDSGILDVKNHPLHSLSSLKFHPSILLQHQWCDEDDDYLSSCSTTTRSDCDRDSRSSRSSFETKETEEQEQEQGGSCSNDVKTAPSLFDPSNTFFESIKKKTTMSPSPILLTSKFKRSMARAIATPCILFIMLGSLRHHNTDAVRMNRENIQFFDVDFKNTRRSAGEIRRAHSHNDYHQKEPLMAALRHGFSSVEVDVFPRGDVLLVGHTRLELNEKNTIDEMYIKPILNIIRREKRKAVEFISTKTSSLLQGEDTNSNNTRRSSSSASHRSRRRVNLPFDTDEGLTLLVDLKADAASSIDLLHQALEPLRPHLTYAKKDGQIRKGKVTVLISGNRPSEESLINSEGERYMFIDGRAKDVERNTDSALVPMVSIPWRSMQLARMFGRGERYMKNLVEQAHNQGKLLRIWGAPNNERNWRTMLRSNVDYLSIDDHAKFATFASRVHRL